MDQVFYRKWRPRKFSEVIGQDSIVQTLHMLTEAAFNALLKTLEEPPPHVVFILATTEVHKVLPTIVSRCQRFNFLSLKVEDIVSRLEKLCLDEGVEINRDALLQVAQVASGSLRDAENILERLILTYGEKLELNFEKNDNFVTDISEIKDDLGSIEKAPEKKVSQEKIPVSNNGNNSAVINNQEINKNSDSIEQLKLSQWSEILNFLRFSKGNLFKMNRKRAYSEYS